MEVKRTYSIQENGQVTLPMEWLRKYGLKKGDLVSYVVNEDGSLTVVPRVALAMKVLDEIGDALKAKGITLAQLMADGRDIRGDILKDKYGIDVAKEDE